MTVVTDLDLMPSWVADGRLRPPWEPEVELVPEIAEWLLDAPVSTVEPRCDCGCAVLDHGAEPVRWAIPGVWPDEPTGPVGPSPAVLAVQEAVASLEGADPALLTGSRALADAEALLVVGQRLRVQLLDRYRDVHDRRLYRQAGFRSTHAWVRDVAPDAVGRDVTLARRLPDLPHVRQSLTDGNVSLTAAGKVVASMRKMRPHLDLPDGLIDGLPGEDVVAAVVDDSVDVVARDRCGLDPEDPAQAAVLDELQERTTAIQEGGGSQHDRLEQACLLRAEQLEPRSLPAALEDVELAVVPSLLEEQDKAAQDKRKLQCTRNDDGTWHVEATLTPEIGEALHAILSAEARRDPVNPHDTSARAAARAARAAAAGGDAWADAAPARRWDHNPDASQPDGEQLVPRSPSKRLHDAFGHALLRYLDHGLGGKRGKVPVQLTATISERTITGAPGAPPARGGSGSPLARWLLHRWWCDAHVTTLLMTRGWTPLGVVHTGRTLTGTERTALEVQFGNRCAGLDCCPGEPNPLRPLVPHHVRKHAEFGTTSLGESLLVCETLHADIHLGGRPIRLRDGRLITEDGFLEDS